MSLFFYSEVVCQLLAAFGLKLGHAEMSDIFCLYFVLLASDC